ncbi:MAG: hypothetical protein M1449_13595 [Candidatus Thermoplasmatota archaeon]|nr:hypothetical protein [Candidatus Thermoplasmatota archaeon]
MPTIAESMPGRPLWQLAPTRDGAGRRLTDFMMLIPRLRSQSSAEIEHASRDIQAVLALHQDVVFADLNLKLNLLWVSLRPRPGAIGELVAAIRLRVPEAVLVGHYAEPR